MAVLEYLKTSGHRVIVALAVLLVLTWAIFKRSMGTDEGDET